MASSAPGSVNKPEEEWRAILSPEQFRILRQKGTERCLRNGNERRNEALEKLEKKYDLVVNIQGDEPLIEPEIIDGVVKALQVAPDAVFSTAATSLKPEDRDDPNQV